ncbi:MAG: dihydropyrimidine dehydrogenase, partial [Verrucomicrobia bacterium]|nr:dihydropyrimidine dehydrogenase [Verrucomicrobiota bacterium]
MSIQLPLKERMKIPRQKMPEQNPADRRTNFQEVNFGLPDEIAMREAQRCLECKAEQCKAGCPVGVKVREFIQLVAAGDFMAAAVKMREDNVLPAITGRVCPQEDQCERVCIVGKKGEPVAIGNLERFIADYERRVGAVGLPKNAPPTGKRVAIVGSGPAALSAAGDLVQFGHAVTVLEALHEIGGV